MNRKVFWIMALVFSLTFAATAGWAGDAEVIDPKTAFPEGPLWHDGRLYYVEYGGHTIMAYDGEQSEKVWEQEGCGPSAVVALPGGDFLVTCYDSGEVVKVSAEGETVAAYKEDQSGSAFLGPNDFAVDDRGGAYFTASGPWESAPIVGKIHYIDPDGRIRMVADDLHYANGLALSPDGDTLYAAESEAGRVIQFQVGEDGGLSDRRLFVRVGQVDPESGPWAYPDGLEVDSRGNLYIGQYSSGRVLAVDPEGNLLDVHQVPSPAAPNLVLGPDEATMYVTAVDETAEAPYWGKVYKLSLK
jgi:sugar lactone lactonase YvrE